MSATLNAAVRAIPGPALAAGRFLLPIALVVAAFLAAELAARNWLRGRRTSPAVATAVAVAVVGVLALVAALGGGLPGPAWTPPGELASRLGLTAQGLRAAPFGLLLGVGEFAALCFLVTVLADVAALVPWSRRPLAARPGRVPLTARRPERRPTVVPARPAASTVGANWLLLTRSGWALRWPALRAVGAPPLGLALVLVQAGGEEILLRGVLWGAVRTAGAVGMAICVTGAVVLLCRLPGFRFDLPTVTTIGFVSIVHNLMVSQGSALLPLALAQVTVLVLAGA